MPLKIYTKVIRQGAGSAHVKAYVKLEKPKTDEEKDKENEEVIKSVEKKRQEEKEDA